MEQPGKTLLSLQSQYNKAKIVNLLNKTLKLYEDAKECIDSFDKNLANKIITDEDIVFNDYAELELDIAFNIAKGPVDKNLRRVLAYLSIIKNISQLAIITNKIVSFVTKLNHRPAASSKKRIISVLALVIEQISNCVEVIDEESAEKALLLAEKDKIIDNEVVDIRKNLLTSIVNRTDAEEINERLFVLTIINYLENSGDQIKRICEYIIYISSAKHTKL